jgi:tetratricopeptide (TPR) repeat protein
VRKRLALITAAVVAATAAALLGGALRGGSAGAVRVAPHVAAASFQSGFGAGDTETLVRSLQQGLRSRPSAKGFALLGLAYQQRARETGDPSWYPRSEAALRRARRLDRHDLYAAQGLASLALSRHRFRDALRLGRRALALSPTTARTYGIVGDALVELGRYGEAFAAFNRFAALKPGLAAYARVAYAAELAGDLDGARRAMLLARDAAQGQAEPTAWTEWQLGKLAWTRGDADEADRRYRASLAALAGYVYALDALAQVEASRGNVRRAIALERRVVERIPLPQFVAQLGDLYATAGDAAAARRQYATIGAIERLLRASGVRTDLETALFDADHGRASIALARRAQADRPSIDGDDVLAWTLARAGRCAEALPWSRRALRLGTEDALKLFHRAWIEDCAGRKAAARTYARRVLALNPHFSLLWSGQARRLAWPGA